MHEVELVLVSLLVAVAVAVAVLAGRGARGEHPLPDRPRRLAAEALGASGVLAAVTAGS